MRTSRICQHCPLGQSVALVIAATVIGLVGKGCENDSSGSGDRNVNPSQRVREPLPVGVDEAETGRPERVEDAHPVPSLTAMDVVQIQLDALRANDDLGEDRGIEVAFRFASPANRIETGPLDRFTRMVKHPMYAPMFEFGDARFGEPQSDDPDRTLIPVQLTKGPHVAIFVFTLVRLSEGQHRGCWMTDGVIRLPTEPAIQPPPQSRKAI